MDQTIDIFNRVLPILILIGLGYWIRRSNFLSESTMEEFKKVAVNIALPAVLFLSFLYIELKLTYFVLFVVLFGLCISLFQLGRVLKQRLQIQHPYFPFVMTGFEYGMLGVSLFGSAYGLDEIGYLAIIDLGHEIFIWFVFLALLLMQRDGLQDSQQLVRAFVRSPVIIAIVLGIGFNMLGIQEDLEDLPVTGGILATLDFLSALIIPLILMIVGYGIHFDRHGIKEVVQVTVMRLTLLVPLALILNIVLVRGLLGLEKAFEAALFTLLILPPPFIIPLYMKPELVEERRYINNVLTFYTVVSIIIFTVYFSLNPEF
jgi:predicted permease